MSAAPLLAAELRRHRCALRLGWYRGRPIAYRSAMKRGAELHVLPAIADEPAVLPHLVDHVVSGGRRHPRQLKRILRRLAPTIFAAPPNVDLRELGPERAAYFRTLARSMAAENVLVALNRNRSHVISIREHLFGYRTLSIHQQLLDRPETLEGLHALMAGRRKLDPRLEAAMEALITEPEVLVPPAVHELPTIGEGFDFTACYRQVHERWFADLSRPSFRWARNPGESRRLRSIRFGCYHRNPHAEIRVHPRLRQPWVAALFVEAVLHHELCHHRQAEDPKWRERHHSHRFRQWERQLPDFGLMKHWERLNLGRFLAPVQAVGPDVETLDDPLAAESVEPARGPTQLDLWTQLGL